MRRHLLFIFLDGVGIGPEEAAINPFVRAPIPTLRALADNAWPTLDDGHLPRRTPQVSLVPTDATLGVAGLPQSGTGTATLLTGVNTALFVGRHAGPYPPAEVRPFLAERGLFAEVARREGREAVAFANAYPPFFFERLERRSARRTTTTQAALAAGIRLRGLDDLLAGRALSADITSGWWHRVAPEVPRISAREAGRRLGRLAVAHTLTVFEFFRTDHLGHRPNLAAAHALLTEVDELVAGVLEIIDPATSLLVIASDHGNCEDLSTSDHTRNPVPILLRGAGHAGVAARIQALPDVTPALLDWLDQPPARSQP